MSFSRIVIFVLIVVYSPGACACSLSAGEVHVDYYGFKHHFQDSGLLLHYLCMELTQHYLSQASAYEKHQQDWQNYMKNNAKNLLKNVSGGGEEVGGKEWRGWRMEGGGAVGKRTGMGGLVVSV